MKARHIRKGGAIAGAALVGALLIAPTAAQATPVIAQEGTESGCAVTGGTLSWGLKESFRSYISGTIANGSWEASDGAEYEIPNFVWSSPTGSIDPATGTGSISFIGTVHFTGHDGVLDLTLANPTIEFEGDGKAALLLDAKSTDMEGGESLDAQQEWVGDVVIDGESIPADGVLDIADAPATLTNSGAKAFAGFYDAGTDLDPLNLSLAFDGCETEAAAPAAPVDAEQQQPAQETDARIPWLPIAIGGAALFVIGLTVGILIGGRGKRGPNGAAANTEEGVPSA